MPINSNTIIDESSSDIQKSTYDNVKRNTGELGKDQFLNLLVTQLKYQDPLNPVDDKEFISQMAQFSSLEQMYNLNNSFSSIKAFALIGKNVTAEIIDDNTSELKIVKGIVDSVKVSGSEIFVVVNDVDVPIDKITKVEAVKDIITDEKQGV